jgi:hypothetical protein
MASLPAASLSKIATNLSPILDATKAFTVVASAPALPIAFVPWKSKNVK